MCTDYVSFGVAQPRTILIISSGGCRCRQDIAAFASGLPAEAYDPVKGSASRQHHWQLMLAAAMQTQVREVLLFCRTHSRNGCFVALTQGLGVLSHALKESMFCWFHSRNRCFVALTQGIEVSAQYTGSVLSICRRHHVTV